MPAWRGTNTRSSVNSSLRRCHSRPSRMWPYAAISWSMASTSSMASMVATLDPRVRVVDDLGLLGVGVEHRAAELLAVAGVASGPGRPRVDHHDVADPARELQ